MKNVTNENFKRAEAELKKQAEELANKVEATPAPIEIQEVVADLGSFSLTDNGDYLAVSHPALQNATIGTISKKEYDGNNKEVLLRSVLEASFSPYFSTHALKITGSFVEPVVKQAEEKPACVECGIHDRREGSKYCTDCSEVRKKAAFGPFEKCTCGHSAFKHSDDERGGGEHCSEDDCRKYTPKPIEPAKEITSDLPLLRSADSFRQNIEREAFKSQEAFSKFIDSTVNNLVAHIKALRYDNPKVIEAIDASNLQLNDNGINGHLVISASLEDSNGPKYLNIPVPVTANKAVFPNEKEMGELVSKALDLRAKLEETLALETLTAMAKVDAEEAWKSEEVANIISEKTAEIKKEASDYTDGVAPNVGPGAHIKLQKHLLPGELADWEVGDTIYSDGKKWKLVSKDDGLDSNDKNAGSASLWDFVECLPEEGDEKVKADIPR